MDDNNPLTWASDTPLAKSFSRVCEGQSLAAEPGRHDRIIQRRVKAAEDMSNHGVPAEHEEFFDEFFPPLSDDMTSNPNMPLTNPFTTLGGPEQPPMLEKDVADKFTAAINDHHLVPGLVLRQCGTRPDPATVDDQMQKIDAAFYRTEFAPDDKRPHWADQLVAVEFKRGMTKYDPFDDGKDNISTDTEDRKQVRGQIITYAELIFAVQQRVALFMLVVIGRKCRFVRWDRSGTVVTRLLDYVKHWRTFCNILWRISQCSDPQLGLDPSATRILPDSDDCHLMHTVAHNTEHDVDYEERPLPTGELPEGQFTYIRTMFRDSLVPEWPCYKLEVPDGDKTRYFLVGKPTFTAKGMAGRGTRGYVAYDCGRKRFVWLKDAWRARYLLVKQEGTILAELNDAKIPYIPTLVCHGDIRGQDTVTPAWWEKKNPRPEKDESPPSPTPTRSSSRTVFGQSSMKSLKRKFVEDLEEDTLSEESEARHREDCPLRLHTHYRLVVEEVAMPLRDFIYPRQLVSILLDCLTAHQRAATLPKTAILHRDISAGNILMYPMATTKKTKQGPVTYLVWKGILADWEMSKPVLAPGKTRRPRQPERTGTLQFMSVSLLSRGPKTVGIPDELESIFHVLLYHVIRYLPSSLSDKDVPRYIYHYFDLYGIEDNTYVCGHKKSDTILNGKLSALDGRTPITFGEPLDTLFSNLVIWFKAYYAVRDNAEAKPTPVVAVATKAPPKFHLPPIVDDEYEYSSTNGSTSDWKKRTTGYVPTSQDEQDAKNVMDHKAMLDVFVCAIHDNNWSYDGKADRIPAGWKPGKEDRFRDSESALSMAGSKRRKVGRVEGIATLPVLAGPLLTTPPKQYHSVFGMGK